MSPFRVRLKPMVKAQEPSINKIICEDQGPTTKSVQMQNMLRMRMTQNFGLRMVLVK